MLECIFGGFLIIVVFAIFVCLIVAFSGEGAEKTSKTYLEIQNKMLQISQKVFSKKVGLQTKLDELDIIEIALDFDELPVKQEDATDLDSCSV